MDDLHALPKIRDSVSFIYVERARIDRYERSIGIWKGETITPIPAAALCVLSLGPGTTITHAAVQALADNNCLVVWSGQENVRFYAAGMGGTRSAAPMLHQARLVCDESQRLAVARRMYTQRFDTPPPADATIDVLRGLEGRRVRDAYLDASEEYSVPWTKREYDRDEWDVATPVNRALSCANSCLYGVCHAAILAAGYSPALGFIHTGKQLSFVYDIADLYKTEISVPVAFSSVADNGRPLERAVRLACRDYFREAKLLQRLVPDIQKLLETPPEALGEFAADSDKALPSPLWKADSAVTYESHVGEDATEGGD